MLSFPPEKREREICDKDLGRDKCVCVCVSHMAEDTVPHHQRARTVFCALISMHCVNVRICVSSRTYLN